MVRFAVGLDLSFKSPGFAIHDLHENKWYVYAFAKLVRDKDASLHTQTTSVTLLPSLPGLVSKKNLKLLTPSERCKRDMNCYLHVEKYLLIILDLHIPKDLRKKDVTKVLIEAYVFSAPEESGNNYKLHESGGIIKRALFLAGFEDVQIITDSEWKRTVVGHGKASKLDVVHFITNNGPCVDMLKFLGYDETKLPPHKKGGIKVPSPSQDLADSSAIAMAVYTKRMAKKPQPKRPRQQKPKLKKDSFWSGCESIPEKPKKQKTKLTTTNSFWSSNTTSPPKAILVEDDDEI